MPAWEKQNLSNRIQATVTMLFNSVFLPNASEMIQVALNLLGQNADSIYSLGCSIS